MSRACKKTFTTLRTLLHEKGKKENEENERLLGFRLLSLRASLQGGRPVTLQH